MTIRFDWLSDELCAVLRWQVANPGRADDHDAPEIPWSGRRIWSIFLALNSTRAGGFGPASISYGEIEAWSRLHREPVRPWEIDIIRAMDAALLRASTNKTEQQPDREVQTRPLSTELFDAMFPGK